MAVFLVDASTTDGGLRLLVGAPGTTFAVDPDADYQRLVRMYESACCHHCAQCWRLRRTWFCQHWRLLLTVWARAPCCARDLAPFIPVISMP